MTGSPLPALALWHWSAVFVASAAVLALAGTALAKAGDELAERTGLGRLLVGMLLVASATSLPEVVTDVSASLADAPDLAVGDLFGSSMANMAILAVVDLTYRGTVWRTVELGHARLAGLAIALTALAALGVMTPAWPRIGWVGLDTVAVAAAYVAAVAWIRRSPASRRTTAAPAAAAGPEVLPAPTGWAAEGGTVRTAALRFAAATAVIFGAAPLVALSARELAEGTGVGETVIGTTLVAVSTSLPELVASLAAVRIGAHDLAVGNLFGSNAANMSVLLLADAAYTDGPILAAVDATQIVPALGAILLMALALSVIVHGRETRLKRFEPDAALLLLAYAGCIVAVWSVRA